MLKVNVQNKGGGSRVKPGKRLCYTADKSRLVPAGDPEAASLYCTENSQVPRAEYEVLMPPPQEPVKEPAPKRKPGRPKKGA